MTRRTEGKTFRWLLLACVSAAGLAGGCATRPFGLAISYQAEKSAVTNAAARHTSASPYYRFNTDLLSDLDDAIQCDDLSKQNTLARAVLRGANALSQTAGANEIERLPRVTREKLAETAGLEPTAAALLQHFSKLAKTALATDLREMDQLTSSALREKLVALRDSVEDLPDDRERSKRKLLYVWASGLTADGIAKQEDLLPGKSLAKAEKKFDRVAIWRPSQSHHEVLLTKYAPILGIAWPIDRGYDSDFDRVGGVALSGDSQHVKVRIDPAAPTVYSYTTVAKIDGRRLQQLNYVWWFSERPEMSEEDPVAGHIDGAMIRITLDAHDEPMFVEASLNCGCDHEVFVSEHIESAARKAFSGPLLGKRFAVEKTVAGKHDVVVIDTFDASPHAAGPLVLSLAGFHAVAQISFQSDRRLASLEIAEHAPYQLEDYTVLDALPFGDGIASMFGPDGLVHFAGRPEGFLLAPSGMLSGGQPRKRGTQRVRWDDYLHDDPHLLEKTLRLPPLD